MTTQEKTTLMTLISDGNIKKAIDDLLAVKRNESLDKEALGIASRYNRLKREERSGTLSPEQVNRRENQIVTHLIDAINHPEAETYPAEKSIYTSTATRPVLWRYIIITATIVAVVLLSLAEAFHIIDIIPSSHQLTVFVEDEKGNPELEGKGRINITLGNRSLNEAIGENGRINFPDITPDNVGDTIYIGLRTEGWEIVGKNTFIFNGESISIKVKRDNSLGTIKGKVTNWDGQESIEGVKVLIEADTTVFTNAEGLFKIILPEKMRIKDENGQYRLTASKAGYKTKHIDYSPLSSPAEFRLEKAENK